MQIDRPEIGQALPDVTPAEGLASTLLANALLREDISTAEYILSIHHENIRNSYVGLPFGRTCYRKIFDFYWRKALEFKQAALFLPLRGFRGVGVFLSIHSDKSALIWRDMGAGQFAPVPHPFYLDISIESSVIPFRYPGDDLLEHTRAKKQSLPSFIARNWADAHETYALTWSGEVDLIDALSHEASTWIHWAKTIKQVIIPNVDTARSYGDGVIYPWSYGIRPMTPEDEHVLKTVFKDLCLIILDQEKLPFTERADVFVDGRPLYRDGTLGDISFHLEGDAFEAISPERVRTWTDFAYALLDSPSFPVPRVAQIAQNWQLRDNRHDGDMILYTTDQLIEVDFKLKQPPSAHERLMARSRIEAFGVELPK